MMCRFNEYAGFTWFSCHAGFVEWGNTPTRVGQMGRPRGPGHMGRLNIMEYYGM